MHLCYTQSLLLLLLLLANAGPLALCGFFPNEKLLIGCVAVSSGGGRGWTFCLVADLSFIIYYILNDSAALQRESTESVTFNQRISLSSPVIVYIVSFYNEVVHVMTSEIFASQPFDPFHNMQKNLI